MPTYQYKCRQCEHRFDVMQMITEEPLTECPECKGEIRRVLFPAGVMFKGSGWYVTDYRNSGEKAKYEAESKGGDSGATAKTDSASTDTKTADAKPAETKPAETSSKPDSSPASSLPAADSKAA